jgi:hypothetical protein
VDPVPDPLLLRKSGSARNRTRTSGLAVSSEFYTLENIVSKTGSASVLRRGEGDTYSVGSLRKSQSQSLDLPFPFQPSVNSGISSMRAAYLARRRVQLPKCTYLIPDEWRKLRMRMFAAPKANATSRKVQGSSPDKVNEIY